MKHSNSEKLVKAIHRKARRKYSAEEKIRIVLEGLRGEESIAELCRREGLNQNVYYRWSKEFLEAGKQRLAGNSKRQATSDEATDLRKENSQVRHIHYLNTMPPFSRTRCGGGQRKCWKYRTDNCHLIVPITPHIGWIDQKYLGHLG